MGVLINETRTRLLELIEAHDRVTAQSPPIVVHKAIRVDRDRAIDIVSLQSQAYGVDTLTGPVADRQSARPRRGECFGVFERRLLVVKLKLAHRCETPVAELVDVDSRPFVFLAVLADRPRVGATDQASR